MADVSWWPKANTWAAGCLEIGYWSPYAELWFQRRLDLIRSHEARPKTAGAWKNDLKVAPNAKRFREALDVASTCVVEEHMEELNGD